MDKEQHRAAKARLVAQMQAGRSWQAAAATAGMQISQSTAYRLLQVVRIRGEAALQDGRHGHRPSCVERLEPSWKTIADKLLHAKSTTPNVTARTFWL